jgi:hypothetical protein
VHSKRAAQVRVELKMLAAIPVSPMSAANCQLRDSRQAAFDQYREPKRSAQRYAT